MKRRLFMLTWAVVTAAVLLNPGCKKSINSPFYALYYRWEWIQSSGGIAGVMQTPESEGYTQSIDFDEKSFFTKYRNNAVVSSGSYTITRARSILDNQEYDMIGLNGQMPNFAITVLTRDTLILREEVFDGFIHTYKR